MRRREFLGTVAAAGVLAAWPPRAARAAGQGPHRHQPAPALKLGVASYSLREFPFEQCLELAKAMDVKYLNFKDVHIPRTDSPDAIRAARAKVEAAGFTVMGGGTITMRNNEADVRKDFEYARLAGMPLIVAAPSTDSLDLVERMAKEFQIKVAIHNHGPEDKYFPSPYDAYELIKNRDLHMGLCVDIGHTVRAGVDPARSVLELRDRVYDLHVKDLTDFKDPRSQVIVGKGAIDIPALFRALIQIGFTGHVGLEYEIDAKNPLPGMQQSLAYMRGVLAGITAANG
jgi:sugar phosphate isomerase/epimerase